MPLPCAQLKCPAQDHGSRLLASFLTQGIVALATEGQGPVQPGKIGARPQPSGQCLLSTRCPTVSPSVVTIAPFTPLDGLAGRCL